MPESRASSVGVQHGRLQQNEVHTHHHGLVEPDFLNLLSFNIQVGIGTASYRHYVTRSWQHVLPHASRMRNLHRIAELLHHYDVVALQEVDGGSLRSGYVNQVEYLARLGAFPYWYQQLNRNFGPLAQHSNGALSRLKPWAVEDHSLPGPPGRGAIVLRFGTDEHALAVVVMHLALGSKVRNKQLSYIRECLSGFRHVILMGDMNTHAADLLECSPLKGLDLQSPEPCATFPSWRPTRCLDHILLSSELSIAHTQVLPIPISDHLPVAVKVNLPHWFHHTLPSAGTIHTP